MKKLFALLLSFALVLSLAACGGETTPTNSDNPPATSQNEENTENDKSENATSLDGLAEIVATDVEDTIFTLTAEYDKLVADIDTYDKYLENTDRIEAFYAKVFADTQALCIKMREYSVDYAETILSSDNSNDDKYDDFDELYDSIYEDAGDEIYDGIYDGILDDMYDDFYDGILDDAYDDTPYDEWSDARSNEYEWWSDTRSDVYEEWSDFRSDVYEFWSDMRSELWSDDIEKAEENIADFQEDIEKLKSNEEPSDSDDEQSESSETPSEEPENTASIEQPEESNSSEELVDGMRPDFKQAMDSYEAFYDEYCDFMKEYADNPTDLELLAEYADMMSKAADMTEKFEAWDEDEMNNEELNYYLDVNNRVMQKLLEVAE